MKPTLISPLDADRGTGRTTRRMQAAPQRAVFVWRNSLLDYPRHLACKIARDDLEIVGPHWLGGRYYMGRDLTGVVLDHDVHLSAVQWNGYFDALARVRP